MDEKVMELLAKILEGQNELRGEISEVRSELRQEIQGVSAKVDKLEMRIESEVVEKLRGLYDTREVQKEAIADVTETLSRVEAKLDVLQMETAHIRRVK